MPFPQANPIKILGNIAGILLMVGGVWILINRLRADAGTGTSTPYDNFFLFIVLLVSFSGVFTEVGRFYFSPGLACWIYIIHLASVLSLFATFPYSKFAHFVYRTLAMIHERMAAAREEG